MRDVAIERGRYWLSWWDDGLVFVVARGAGAAIAALYPQADAPYRQIFVDIVTGIERGMGTEPVHARELSDVPDAAAVRHWLEGQSPSAAITLGRVATEIYEKIGLPFPQVVGALDVSPQTRPNVAGVSLAVDPSLLFATLRQLAPSRRRVWAVFDPAYDGWPMELARPAAVALGLRLELREAGDLRASVREFRRILEDADPKTDALWLLADTRIIHSETVLPLVIENGWQRRLPVFSNSLQHIRRGVLFALYPDNLLLGRRLAELAGRARPHRNLARSQPGAQFESGRRPGRRTGAGRRRGCAVSAPADRGIPERARAAFGDAKRPSGGASNWDKVRSVLDQIHAKRAEGWSYDEIRRALAKTVGFTGTLQILYAYVNRLTVERRAAATADVAALTPMEPVRHDRPASRPQSGKKPSV